MTETPACPSCGAPGPERLGTVPAAGAFAGAELKLRLPEAGLWRCGTCHLNFKWPRITKEQADALYAAPGGGPAAYQAENRADWAIIRRELSSLKPGRVLDVGCHDGGFLLSLGAGWTREGIEIGSAAAEKARAAGVRIVGADFGAAGLAGGYAAITAIDVIEHSASPAAFLGGLAPLLAPGGLLAVSTGDSDSAYARLLGARYWYSALPEHISFIGRAWCAVAAPAAGLAFERAVQFSHGDGGGAAAFLSESAKNLLYRFAPGAARALRLRGLGGVDASSRPELADSPPSWRSSRDHFVAFFRRQG